MTLKEKIDEGIELFRESTGNKVTNIKMGSKAFDELKQELIKYCTWSCTSPDDPVDSFQYNEIKVERGS